MTASTLACHCGSKSVGERFSVEHGSQFVCGDCGAEGKRGRDEAQARQFWNAMVTRERWGRRYAEEKRWPPGAT